MTKSNSLAVDKDYAALVKQLKEKDIELNDLRSNQRVVTNSESIINDLTQENE